MGCKGLLLGVAIIATVLTVFSGRGVAGMDCTTWANPDLPYCVELADNVVTQWSIVNDTITFNHTVQSPDVAVLGLGLSETGSMKGADMFILTGPAPKWTLTDRFADGFEAPEVDDHQGLLLRGVYSKPSSGILSVAFSRKLTPCDVRDLPIRRGEKLYLQYAYGRKFGYHGRNRGSQVVELFPAAAPAALPDAETTAPPLTASTGKKSSFLNITMAKVLIPPEETKYMYQWIKLPSDKKYHILSYRPLLGSTQDLYAHHAVVYACSPDMNDKLDAMPNKGPIPDTRINEMLRCMDFYMLVTPWSKTYRLPAQAALPFGKGSYSWMMLEMHYNNPQLISGVNDTGSGIVVEYTDQLRPHDMGLITITQLALRIPPGQKRVEAPTSYCLGSCTKLRLPSPVNLVAQSLHMHGLGKSAITRRFRGGQELSPLANLRTFDYKFQPFMGVPADAKVLRPGDSLALTCIFDSTSRTNETRMGPGTRDEMCFNWIYYWPAQPDFGVCSTLPGNDNRPPIGLCAADLSPLSILGRRTVPGAAQAAMELYMSGRVMNATVPRNYTKYTETCTKAVAA